MKCRDGGGARSKLFSYLVFQVKIVIDLENSDGCKWIFIVLSTAAAPLVIHMCVECAF